MQYNTIQYNTIQYNLLSYNTIQYNTIQYCYDNSHSVELPLYRGLGLALSECKQWRSS